MRGYNPLAPRTPRQLRLQARSAVGATFNPLFAQLNRRESSNQAMIRDYTSSLASMLAPLAGQIQGYYANAQNQQQQVDTSLANRLNSVGGQEAAALQSRLSSAGLPTDQAQRVSAVGSGAANTTAALGSAALSQLLSTGAAQTAYAGKLPGIAALGGLQFAKQNLAQMEQQRSDLQAKVPGAIQTELGQLQNLEFQKGVAIQGGLVDQAKMNLDVAKTKADYGLKVAKGKQPNASLSRAYGYIVDANGNPILRGGKRVPVARAATGSPAKAHDKRVAAFYTTRQKTFNAAKSMYGSGGSGGAGGAANPFTPSTGGSKAPKATAQQAYTRLWSQYGTQLVNQYNFKRGAVDVMIRKALRAAGYNLPTRQQQAAAAAGAAAATSAVGSLGL